MTNAIDQLLQIKPFSTGCKFDNIFLQAMSESLCYHYDHSQRFKDFCKKKNFNPYSEFKLEDIPFIPSNIFKKIELLSVPKDQIIKTIQSSSTTGNTPSTIFIDKITSDRQLQVIISILSDFIGTSRKNFIILESRENIDTGNKISSRSSAVRGLTPFMKNAFFILNNDLTINQDELSKIQPVGDFVIFGFTWIIYLLIEKYQNDDNIKRSLQIFNNPLILHSGGWKKLQSIKISKSEFNENVSEFFKSQPKNVIDFYGMVEQLGTIYPDCEYGNKHVPRYSHIIIRDIETLKPTENGNKGFIQILTPIPHSYPGISVLTDDIGKIVGRDTCQCGRKGTYFRFVERLKTADLAGCGDTFEM